MALSELIRTPSFPTRMLGAVVQWNDKNRTRAALSKLSLHELEDIGLVPGDIDAMAGTFIR